METRPYQKDVISKAKQEIRKGYKAILIQAGTGTGKTVIGAEILRGVCRKGNKALFLAHRRELIHQCSDKMTAFDVPHGVIMSGVPMERYHPVQVASIDTLRARVLNRQAMPMPDAQVIMIDEAHRSLANTYKRIIDCYPDAILIGLTATPCRADGRGLGDIYESMVQAPPIGELIKMGFLVPVDHYCPSTEDFSKIKIKNGEYDLDEMGEKMSAPKMVGDAIANWAKLARNEKTVGFTPRVKNAVYMAEAFRNAGVNAAYLDGSMDIQTREGILDDFKSDKLQVLFNCGILTEGWDMPAASCCLIYRATKSLGLYLQMAGRVLRPWPGKERAVILDHGGCYHEHQVAVDDYIDWSLDCTKKIQDVMEKPPREKVSKPITCEQCGTEYEKQRVCPSCGAVPTLWGKRIEFIDADLVEIGKKDKPAPKADKQKWYSMLLGYADEKRYSPGWAAHAYREKFGVWPRSLERQKELPDIEVSGWIRHRNIRNAKRKATA